MKDNFKGVFYHCSAICMCSLRRDGNIVVSEEQLKGKTGFFVKIIVKTRIFLKLTGFKP